jgi:hypothetical protein
VNLDSTKTIEEFLQGNDNRHRNGRKWKDVLAFIRFVCNKDPAYNRIDFDVLSRNLIEGKRTRILELDLNTLSSGFYLLAGLYSNSLDGVCVVLEIAVDGVLVHDGEKIGVLKDLERIRQVIYLRSLKITEEVL